MKIYTRTGDAGTTALYGGERVPKDALRVEAYGTVDEANALLGVARAQLGALTSFDALLETLQHTLFEVGADLATPESRYRENIVPLTAEDTEGLEQEIDRLEAGLAPLKAFILPGGHPASASLHHARTVVRRAERCVVALSQHEAVNSQVAVYLNRLSDLLFVLARAMNAAAGVADPEWRARQTGASKTGAE
jgi:cob(I)alamin adenosyltransferase